MERISLQDALDYCLENPDGLSTKELLDTFPQHRAELATLLGLGVVIEATPPPVPAERRAAMKARILEAAAQLQPPEGPTGATSTAATYVAPAPAPVPVPVAAAARRSASGPVPISSHARKRSSVLLRPGFLVAVAAALIIAFVWWSAHDALPDSPFYNVRIAGENFAINFAGSDENQASAHLDAATARLYDLREMQKRDKLALAQDAVVDYEKHLSSAETLWQRISPPSVDVAAKLYASSIAGRTTFDGMQTVESTLPAPYRRDILEANASIDRVGGETEQALVEAGRDPAAVLADVASSNTRLAELITPGASASPGPTAPSAGSTTTGGAAGEQTPTVVAVVPDTPTVAVVVPLPAASTPHVEPPRATPTPPRATPSPPRATPSPPRATPSVPVGPSLTHTPPVVHTPPAGPPTLTVLPTFTAVPEPPATRTPVLASVCDLSITNVVVSCREQGGVNWSAAVINRGTEAVTASWVAELQVQDEGSSGFVPVSSMFGTDVFQPGPTLLSHNMIHTFGPTALKARVVLRIDTTGYACTVPSRQSLDVPACNKQSQGPPETTKTPPGLENKPTKEPRPPKEPDGNGGQGGPPDKP